MSRRKSINTLKRIVRLINHDYEKDTQYGKDYERRIYRAIYDGKLFITIDEDEIVSIYDDTIDPFVRVTGKISYHDDGVISGAKYSGVVDSDTKLKTVVSVAKNVY